MKDFKTIWKKLSSEKQATNADTFAYCALRAFAQTTYNKNEALDYFLLKHYTPRTAKKHQQFAWQKFDKYQKINEAKGDLTWKLRVSKTILNQKLEDIFESEEEQAEFIELVHGVKNYD